MFRLTLSFLVLALPVYQCDAMPEVISAPKLSQTGALTLQDLLPTPVAAPALSPSSPHGPLSPTAPSLSPVAKKPSTVKQTAVRKSNESSHPVGLGANLVPSTLVTNGGWWNDMAYEVPATTIATPPPEKAITLEDLLDAKSSPPSTAPSVLRNATVAIPKKISAQENSISVRSAVVLTIVSFVLGSGCIVMGIVFILCKHGRRQHPKVLPVYLEPPSASSWRRTHRTQGNNAPAIPVKKDLFLNAESSAKHPGFHRPIKRTVESGATATTSSTTTSSSKQRHKDDDSVQDIYFDGKPLTNLSYMINHREDEDDMVSVDLNNDEEKKDDDDDVLYRASAKKKASQRKIVSDTPAQLAPSKPEVVDEEEVTIDFMYEDIGATFAREHANVIVTPPTANSVLDGLWSYPVAAAAAPPKSTRNVPAHPASIAFPDPNSTDDDDDDMTMMSMSVMGTTIV
jgi:hypothetical protein